MSCYPAPLIDSFAASMPVLVYAVEKPSRIDYLIPSSVVFDGGDLHNRKHDRRVVLARDWKFYNGYGVQSDALSTLRKILRSKFRGPLHMAFNEI